MATPYEVLPDDFQCERCVQHRMPCLSDCPGRAEVICDELVRLRATIARIREICACDHEAAYDLRADILAVLGEP